MAKGNIHNLLTAATPAPTAGNALPFTKWASEQLDPTTIAGIGYLVQTGLLQQARADEVLAS